MKLFLKAEVAVLKLEARNPKSETNPKFKFSNAQNGMVYFINYRHRQSIIFNFGH
jgi:hypothetical protein